MVFTTSPAAGIASTVLALSKAAWRLGASLSKLDHEYRSPDTILKSLADGIRSLSDECDLLHAELEGIKVNTEVVSFPSHETSHRLWNCLATEVKETSET